MKTPSPKHQLLAIYHPMHPYLENNETLFVEKSCIEVQCNQRKAIETRGKEFFEINQPSSLQVQRGWRQETGPPVTKVIARMDAKRSNEIGYRLHRCSRIVSQMRCYTTFRGASVSNLRRVGIRRRICFKSVMI